MNAILALLLALAATPAVAPLPAHLPPPIARPACPPVTAADLELALALETAAPRTDARQAAADRIPGRFVAGFQPGRLAETLDWLAAWGGRPVRVDTAAGFIVCQLPDAAGLALAARPLPDAARWFEPDARTRAGHLPNDPHFLTRQWDKWVMYADLAWDLTRGSSNIAVAICDNGVDYTHPDLADRFVPGEFGYDFVAGDNDPKPDNPAIPQAFHGTHVAGITAATMDNAVGIAGWAGARLLAVKVLNDSGSGTMSTLASGIRWAADRGARVVNMSLGSDDYSTPVAEAAAYAAGRGVLLVAAAGNSGAGLVQYPARLPEVLCVGALDRAGGRAEYSNYGSHLDVTAPGSEITSAVPGGSYGIASGTSMASPQVVGVAALVLAANPALGPGRARAVIAASAVDLGPAGWDQWHGHGLVNAFRAVTLAGRMAERPRPAGNAGAKLVSGNWRLPDWAETAVLYDVTGRGRPVLGREINLAPGTWFVRLAAPGRQELVRLSAAR